MQGLNKPVKALLAPKGYTGESHGLVVVCAPTKRVLLFACLLVVGQEDIPRVIRPQNQLIPSIYK